MAKQLNDIIKSIKLSNNDSKLIDKFLVPNNNEKQHFAEISTPYELRKKMLDKLPAVFWTKPRTILEPCSGKGGFLIDIIDRYMTGLINTFPDPDKRYKFIVEECLYFLKLLLIFEFHEKFTLSMYP